MIDLHAHILPEVDDGAESLAEALEIAKEAERQGVSAIVATPHYLEEGYQLTPTETEEKVKNLQEKINKEGIDIKILPGAEVYLTPDLPKNLNEGLVSTINNSRYILVELPMRRMPDYADDLLYDLQVMGYTPVIAHPERYQQVLKDPNYLLHWIEDGILAQVNAGSLLGMFGSKVKETAEILVEHNLVQLMGSDLHSNNQRRECLQEGRARLRELVGNKVSTYFKNAYQVINDEDINVVKPKIYQSQQGLLTRLKVAFGMGS